MPETTHMVTSCLWLTYFEKKEECYFSKVFIVQYYTAIIVTDLFILGIYELILSNTYFRSALQFVLVLCVCVLGVIFWRISFIESNRKGFSEKFIQMRIPN